MQGYRTLLLAALTVVSGVLFPHIAPSALANYADVIIAGIGLLFGGLRFVTSTPLGKQVVQQIVQAVPASDEVFREAESITLPDFGQIADNLNAAVAKLDGHPLVDPASLQAITALVATATPIAAPAPADTSALADLVPHAQALIAGLAALVPAAVAQSPAPADPQPQPQPIPAPAA